MKPAHLILFVITATVFISTFFISQGVPTGFLVSEEQNVGLEITGIDAYDTEAVISWETETDALSMLVINNNQLAFETSTHFSKAISGLSPNTRYEFLVKACNENLCEEKRSELVTSASAGSRSSSPLTGAIIGADIARTMQTSIGFIFYALIGIIAIAVVGRIGYEKVASSRDQMAGMVKSANKMIENEQYREAYEIYSKARQAYTELEEAAKLKHYDSLVSIYQTLKRYSEVKEAQKLAEKYAEGTITKEEMRRLNNMLAN